MKIVAFLQELLGRGMALADAMAMASAFEDSIDLARGTSLVPSTLEKRRAYDRERKAAKKAESGNSTGIPPEPCDAQFHRNSTGIPPETPPLAHVRDKPLTKVLSGITTAADEMRASDDWPEGSVKEHAAHLVEICATTKLDTARQGGLTLTLARLNAWKVAGASWEFDVVPVVSTLVAKARKPITSWKYFDDAIADSIAANREALTIPEAANVTQIRPGTGPPRQSITDRIAEENQQVHDRLAAEIARRNARPN
jgi:hypothetical protein